MKLPARAYTDGGAVDRQSHREWSGAPMHKTVVGVGPAVLAAEVAQLDGERSE